MVDDQESKLVIQEDPSENLWYRRAFIVYVGLSILCLVAFVIGLVFAAIFIVSGGVAEYSFSSAWIFLILFPGFAWVGLNVALSGFRSLLRRQSARIIVGTQKIQDATAEPSKVPESECKSLIFKAHNALKDSGGSSSRADVLKYIAENYNVDITYSDDGVSGRRK